MKRQLEGYEAPFIYVTSGERFEDCRNGRFTMNFAKDEDYDALCGVLRSQNIRPRHIIHFFSRRALQKYGRCNEKATQ
ncbi:hypothetical protein ACNSPU_07610 [Bacillus velezensis]